MNKKRIIIDNEKYGGKIVEKIVVKNLNTEDFFNIDWFSENFSNFISNDNSILSFKSSINHPKHGGKQTKGLICEKLSTGEKVEIDFEKLYTYTTQLVNHKKIQDLKIKDLQKEIISLKRINHQREQEKQNLMIAENKKNIEIMQILNEKSQQFQKFKKELQQELNEKLESNYELKSSTFDKVLKVCSDLMTFVAGAINLEPNFGTTASSVCTMFAGASGMISFAVNKTKIIENSNQSIQINNKDDFDKSVKMDICDDIHKPSTSGYKPNSPKM